MNDVNGGFIGKKKKVLAECWFIKNAGKEGLTALITPIVFLALDQSKGIRRAFLGS